MKKHDKKAVIADIMAEMNTPIIDVHSADKCKTKVDKGEKIKALNVRHAELKSLFRQYPKPEIEAEIAKIEARIESELNKALIERLKNGKVVKRFLSKRFNEYFELLDNDTVVFDNGAVYSKEEISGLDKREMKIVHSLKKKFDVKYIGVKEVWKNLPLKKGLI